MRAVPKSGKRVVESHVADKALRRVSETLKGQIGHIARPKNGRHEHYEVGVYNAMVMGMHNYYSMATHVSKDFKRLSKEIGIVWRCRLRNRLERKGEIKNKAIQSKYGSSRQMRFLGGTPVVPIGFVQTHPPRWKKRSINAYLQNQAVAQYTNILSQAQTQLAAAQAANDPEKINQATQAVTNAQTALNNANAAVKNTEAQLQAVNNELTLASNGWYSAGEAMRTAQAAITTIGNDISLAESEFRKATVGITDMQSSVPGLTA